MVTTIYRQRTFHERIAQSNVEVLQAQIKQLRTRMALLLDSHASDVPMPPAEIVRYLERAEYHGCLNADSTAWLRLVKERTT